MRRVVAVAVAIGVAMLLVPLAAGAEPGLGPAVALPRLVGAAASGDRYYGAISCPSASTCTAVGPTDTVLHPTTSKAAATAITESGDVWSRTSLPTPAGSTADSTIMDDVACVDQEDCVAVGATTSSGKVRPLIDTETSGSWSDSILPLPSGTQSAVLVAVWCASAGNCVTSGYGELSGTDIKPFVATETGGAWATAVPLGVPAGAAYLIPQAMTCNTLASCTLIAWRAQTTVIRTLTWTETGGTWGSPTPIPSPAHTGGFLGTGVACPTASTCIAVGGLAVGQGGYPAVAVASGGTWGTARRLPAPRLSPVYPQGALAGIACSDASHCEAVGEMVANDSGSPQVGAAVTWTDTGSAMGTWSSINLLSVPRMTAYLSADACGAADVCEAMGDAASGTKASEPKQPIVVALTPMEAVTTPGAPTALAIRPVAHGVIASWLPPAGDGGSPIETFTATVARGARHWTCTTTGRRCRFNGLRTGEAYRITVDDTSAGGSSPRTRSLTVVAGPLPSAPRALRASLVNGGVILAWDRARAPGERVTYEVLAARGSSRTILRTASTQCELRLTVHAAYRVSVVAVDRSGTGPAASLHIAV